MVFLWLLFFLCSVLYSFSVKSQIYYQTIILPFHLLPSGFGKCVTMCLPMVNTNCMLFVFILLWSLLCCNPFHLFLSFPNVKTLYLVIMAKCYIVDVIWNITYHRMITINGHRYINKLKYPAVIQLWLKMFLWKKWSCLLSPSAEMSWKQL